MSSFGGLVLTNKGKALQSKVQAGTTLNFVRVVAGDGDLGGALIPDLTSLIHEVMTLPITKVKPLLNGKALVRTVLSNQNVVTGFYFREIGVIAQDPDEGEVLYCYGNSGANAEFIPTAGGPDVVEKIMDVITIVNNTTDVTAEIDESLVFETLAGAQEKANIAEANAKIYTDSLIITNQSEPSGLVVGGWWYKEI